jgi:hypothetical protein
MSPEKFDIEVSEDGISRRRMLKRIGAGAAVAWTAPVLTSIRTPAFAATPPSAPCPPGSSCAGDICFGQSICDPNPPPFGCPCAQVVGNESQCFCYQDDLCVNRTPCPGGQGDCPAGQACVHTCCDAAIGSPVCWQPCAHALSGKHSKASGSRGGQR